MENTLGRLYIFCLLEVKVTCDLAQVNGQRYIKTKVTIRLGIKFHSQKAVFVILITLLVSEFTIQSAVPSGHEDSTDFLRKIPEVTLSTWS